MGRISRKLLLAGIALGAAASLATADDRSVCGSVPPKSGAIAACSRIIASARTSANDRGLAYALRADILRGQGDFAGAIADYSQALTSLPDFVAALNGRGVAYLSTGDNAKAIADFNKALQLDPQNAKALYGRGLARRKSGDTTGGDADIGAAEKLKPDVAEHQ